jgi:cyclohexa-1,5-dienecarbonyl-CoA hydratase
LSIQTAFEGRLARITLARPPLNILDIEHLRQLGSALEECRDESIALVVIDAEGKAFSAGNDIKDHIAERAPEMLEAFHGALRTLLDLDAVVLADVRGAALGGGCEIVACCDLAYASTDAVFGQPEIDVGCFPPAAAVMLPFRIGWTRAMEMIVTGRRIDGHTAAAWGLITAVSEPPLEPLLAKSPAVLRLAKKAMRPGGLEQAEEIYLEELLAHPDCAEGVDAFLKKRRPNWSDTN